MSPAAKILQGDTLAEFERIVTEQRRTERVRDLPAQEEALLEVFKIGPEVIGSKNEFISWLNRPNVPLGGKTPLQLLLLKKAQQVREALLRIEYGISA